MSATVWKFVWPLPSDRAEFDMPRGAEILTVANQYNQVCLWARVNPLGDLEKRRFALVGTGHAAPGAASGRYLGTAFLHDETLVLHVFERLGE